MASLKTYKRVAIKIGSALLVDDKTGKIKQSWLAALAEDIAHFAKHDTEILIISSGAIALGRNRLSLNSNALTLSQKQACAAAGQAVLTQAYEAALAPYSLVTAQALLTLNDTENRRRWMNAKATLSTLLTLRAIPIINENDTVATDEIRYGDNDRLAARVAQMVEADLLILLSDVDGLYDIDPTQNTNARHIPFIAELTSNILAMGGGINNAKAKNMGSGGMATKLQAAKIATEAGCTMVIAKGTQNHPLAALESGSIKSSWFAPKTNTLAARKQWIAGSLKPNGNVMIDLGAEQALRSGKSLLNAGVTQINGAFNKGDAVLICDQNGMEIARGLCSYNDANANLIKGLKSSDIQAVLGYDSGMPLIHRDNMVLTS